MLFILFLLVFVKLRCVSTDTSTEEIEENYLRSSNKSNRYDLFDAKDVVTNGVIYLYDIADEDKDFLRAYSKPYYDVKNPEYEFTKYLQNHRKEYYFDKRITNIEYEGQRRFNKFRHNMKMINNFNTQYKGEVFHVNDFADLTFEEFQSNWTGYSRTSTKPAELYKGHRFLKSINWNQEGYSYVRPAPDQKGCKSSYAFAAVACIESQHAIVQRAPPVAFSTAQAFTCEPTGSCEEGGSPDAVMQTIMDMGGPVFLHGYQKYNVSDGIKRPCDTSERIKRKVRVQIDKVVRLELADERSLMDVLTNVGPVVTTIEVSLELMLYKSGILRPHRCHTDSRTDYTDHAVLVYGYGSEKGRDFWLARNSWGPLWGENGSFRLARGGWVCGFGKHYVATTIHSKVIQDHESHHTKRPRHNGSSISTIETTTSNDIPTSSDMPNYVNSEEDQNGTRTFPEIIQPVESNPSTDYITEIIMLP